MKTSQILIAALDIIDTPGKWTQGTYAKSLIDGELVSAWDVQKYKPECFCSLGAMKFVIGLTDLTDCTNESLHAANYLAECAPLRSIVSVNDHAYSQFDKEMSEMWLGAIFNALADET